MFKNEKVRCAACEDLLQYFRIVSTGDLGSGGAENVPANFTRDYRRHVEDEHERKFLAVARREGFGC